MRMATPGHTPGGSTVVGVTDHFRPRCATPTGLVRPVRCDPSGRSGPTKGQARGPLFRRTTPDRYVPAGTSRSVEQRIVEQAERLPSGGAIGGWASLRLHGAAYFDGRGPDRRELAVPLVLPPGRTLHPFPGGRVVRPSRAPVVVRVHGVPCLDPYDAMLQELAGAADHLAALVAVDMALASGVVELLRLCALKWDQLPRRGRVQVRRALNAADPRSLSPRETWLRTVWTGVAGLRPPGCNWTVLGPDGLAVATPDLLDVDLGVGADYDGAAHRDAGRHRQDERRREAMLALGLQHVTVVGQGPGDEADVARRLRAAADRAVASYEAPRLWSAREGRLPSW